jgi:uncharacterized protein (TIGR00255 family)
MTGYGCGTVRADGREITVELKSVNHRYLDLGMRLPRHITFLEDMMRVEIGAALNRGHIDIFINYKNIRNDAKVIELDEALFSQYLALGKDAANKFHIQDDLTLSKLLRLPDVVNVTVQEDMQAVIALTKEAAQNAIAQLKAMRREEGGRLYDDLTLHIGKVAALTEEIEMRAPLVVREYRDKLSERIAQLLNEAEIDRARLSTEVALFADKAGIDEEIVRLKSHIIQFEKTLLTEEPVGRKLDFLVQEINRELNTIGSKANDVGLTNAVLAGKGEVEKLREQVQNVE